MPPKKTNTALWIILAIVGGVIILCCGFGAIFALTSDTSDDEAGDSGTAESTNVQTDSPTPTKPTKESSPQPDEEETTPPEDDGAITFGNWEVVGRIQVTREDFTGDYAVITRVRNTSDSPDEGFFTVTILKGDEILGTADCTTATIEPGAIGTADCISTDQYRPGWTEITIENMF